MDQGNSSLRWCNHFSHFSKIKTVKSDTLFKRSCFPPEFNWYFNSPICGQLSFICVRVHLTIGSVLLSNIPQLRPWYYPKHIWRFWLSCQRQIAEWIRNSNTSRSMNKMDKGSEKYRRMTQAHWLIVFIDTISVPTYMLVCYEGI